MKYMQAKENPKINNFNECKVSNNKNEFNLQIEFLNLSIQGFTKLISLSF